MKKQGLHYLAYSLILDPEEEIRGAIEAVKEEGRLETIVAGEKTEGIEASVAEAPVLYHENSASYKADTVELPENYKDSGYKAPNDDDDDVEVDYAFETDHAQCEAAKDYVKEIDKQVFANALGISHAPSYSTAEERERMENYKMSLGMGICFLLYDLRAKTF